MHKTPKKKKPMPFNVWQTCTLQKVFFSHPVSDFMASVLQKYLPVLLVRPCLHFAKYCCSRLIF